MNKLEILEKSLQNKQAKFDTMLQAHFSDVKSANGQPLNDKKNGAKTMQRWDRQSDSLRRAQEGVERTKTAIEKEQNKVAGVENAKKDLPTVILSLIESGDLIQWRQHPHTFFVPGVEKARIVWDIKAGNVAHKYTSALKGSGDSEGWKKFAQTYNALYKALKQ